MSAKKAKSGPLKEQRVYGRHACFALWQARPRDIRKVYLLESLRAEFGGLLKFCAQSRIGYRFVVEEELEKISGAAHHEGIVVAALPKAITSFSPRHTSSPASHVKGVSLFLVGVENPHNVGAVIRTAAHFGVPTIYLSPPIATLSSASLRVAEGGAERVEIVSVANPCAAITAFKKARRRVFATLPKTPSSLYTVQFRDGDVIVLGGESDGIPEDACELCDFGITIPGTGSVESLNIATAAGIITAEAVRQLSYGGKKAGLSAK